MSTFTSTQSRAGEGAVREIAEIRPGRTHLFKPARYSLSGLSPEDMVDGPQGTLHHRDFRPTTSRIRSRRADSDLYYMPDGLSYGHYNGSTIERSNVETFLAQHAGVDGVWEVRGGHGSRSVAVRLDVDHDGVLAALGRLLEHPVLDSLHLAELEYRLEREAEAPAARRFWRAVTARFDDAPELQGSEANPTAGATLLDDWPEEGLVSLMREMMERTGEQFTFDHADAPGLDTGRLAEAVTRADLTP